MSPTARLCAPGAHAIARRRPRGRPAVWHVPTASL